MPIRHFSKLKKLLISMSALTFLFHHNDSRNIVANVTGGSEYSNNAPELTTFCVNGSYLSKNYTDENVNSTYSVLYDYLNGTGSHNFSESVTIGFLGAYRQAQVVLGALPLAVEAVNEDKDLLPGRRLSYFAVDIGTNLPAFGVSRSKSSLAAQAIRVMTEMRDNGTVAFIGPDDTCYSEALVAAAWNLPMISYVVNFSAPTLRTYVFN